MITPAWEPHRTLQEDVTAYMVERGYIHEDRTYHRDKKTPYSEALSRVYTPAALSVRAEADQVALHPGMGIVFKWDAKTHAPGPLHDGCFEALPLAVHVTLARLGMLDCLYAYRDHQAGIECGFWASDQPTISRILIPPRADLHQDTLRFFLGFFETVFPGVEAIRTRNTRGSDDPFVIVPERVMRTLPDWRDLVDGANMFVPYRPFATNGNGQQQSEEELAQEWLDRQAAS